jgi:hypothetical protein
MSQLQQAAFEAAAMVTVWSFASAGPPQQAPAAGAAVSAPNIGIVPNVWNDSQAMPEGSSIQYLSDLAYQHEAFFSSRIAESAASSRERMRCSSSGVSAWKPR